MRTLVVIYEAMFTPPSISALCDLLRIHFNLKLRMLLMICASEKVRKMPVQTKNIFGENANPTSFETIK